MAFSPDGNRRGQRPTSGRPDSHTGAPLVEGSSTAGLGFSPDGRRLTGETNDGLIRLWEPTSGMVVLEPEGYGSGSPVVWGHSDGDWPRGSWRLEG